MPRSHLGIAVAAACLTAPLSAALADDRDPTPAELVQIEDALRAEGFVAWDDIEWENGLWKVEEAETPNGEEYDLTLDESLRIVASEED